MPNASDIITYIGIPLAVLGVLPIIYSAINSVITIRKVQQALRRNGLSEASTRSSLMSGIVEVSLPRFSITPLDREEDGEYWKLNPNASTLKGGSWTIFNWNCLITGSRLYRLQYSDELQIPQADIDFEELLSFLLDRGAVPDVKGLHMLRLAGLWTPTGTSLMLSPDTTKSVLKVALPNDSDGILSLALHWNPVWDNREHDFLPPGWMRLQLPQPKDARLAEDEKSRPTQDMSPGPFPLEKVSDAARPEKPPPQLRPMSIRFRLGHRGDSVTISNAIWEHENMPLAESLTLDHFRSGSASIWAPSIALALGLSKSFPLYNHHLDPSLTSLASRESIPCGVLVTLGLLDESKAPPWETKYDRSENAHRFQSDILTRNREINAENKMSPDQANIARTKRLAAEMQQRMDRARMDMQRDRERRATRQREAIGSPRLDTTVVSNAALKHLKDQNSIDDGDGFEAAVETFLIGIMNQEEPLMVVCTILEKWRAWTDRGGMTIADLETLEKEKLAFCNAACVMGLIKEVSTKEESAVALDMRECVEHWKKVRLG